GAGGRGHGLEFSGLGGTMKRIFLGVLTLAVAFAEPLTQGERDRAMSHFHATRKMFLDSIAGLSDAQWNFKAGPDRWSIAEVSEHITISEDILFGAVQKAVAGPAEPEKKAQAHGKDETILRVIPDRSVKAQAPEFLVPKRRWPNREELVAHFKQSRDGHI